MAKKQGFERPKRPLRAFQIGNFRPFQNGKKGKVLNGLKGKPNRSGLYCPRPFRNDSKQAVLNGSKMPVLEQFIMGPGERFSFLKVKF